MRSAASITAHAGVLGFELLQVLLHPHPLEVDLGAAEVSGQDRVARRLGVLGNQSLAALDHRTDGVAETRPSH